MRRSEAATTTAPPAPHSVISGGENNTAGNTYAAVGGGQNNAATGYGSTIAGGIGNLADGSRGAVGGGWFNQAGGTYSAVAGGLRSIAQGDYSVVAGGRFNTSSADSATVGGGDGNHASGIFSVIAGGVANRTGGWSASVGGSETNSATSSYSTIPGGKDANATAYGQLAYASGRFSNAGDAQASLYVLRNTTNDATETELFLDGGSQRVSVSDGRAMSFDILVVGRSSAGTVTLSHIVGIIENTGGTTRVPTAIVAQTYTDASGGATAVADDTNDALAVKVTGVAATNMRWVATVRTAEVSW